MKQKARILVSLLSLMVFLVCLPGIAAADDQAAPPTNEGITGNEPQNGLVINAQDNSNVRTSLINQWTCGISDNGNGSVMIMGETATNGNVDYLDVKVYLQRWNGSNWVDISNRTYSDSSYYFVRGSSSISVSTGYYYRTRGVHTARKTGSSDTQTSVSNAMLIQ